MQLDLLPTWAPLGGVYKTAKGLAVDIISEVETDQGALKASAIICTGACDREGEMIMPGGVRLDDYRNNPVVLWEHGLDPMMPLPIAKCEHPDGRLAIDEQTDDLISATSYFTDKTPESYQVFCLIDEGIVRATSIHVLPDFNVAVKQTVRGNQVSMYPVSDLMEWSWGCIGVNPEAVAKVLDRRTLGNEKICDAIAKTLRPHYPVRKTFGKGWTPPKPEEKPVPKAFEKSLIKTMSTEEIEKSMPEADDPSKAAMQEELATREADAAADAAEGETSELPPSGQVLSAIHGSLSQLLSNIEAASSMYENPDVKEYVTGLTEELQAKIAEIDGLFSTVAEGKSLAKTDATEEGESEEEVMKTWLSGRKPRGYQVTAIAAQAERMSRAKNMKPAQAAELRTFSKQLRSLVGTAKTVQTADNTKLIKALDELKAEHAELRKELAAARRHDK